MVAKKYLISNEVARRKVIAEINVILDSFSVETLESLLCEMCSKCSQRSLDTLLRLREFGDSEWGS